MTVGFWLDDPLGLGTAPTLTDDSRAILSEQDQDARDEPDTDPMVALDQMARDLEDYWQAVTVAHADAVDVARWQAKQREYDAACAEIAADMDYEAWIVESEDA
jgi:hypothetical protein